MTHEVPKDGWRTFLIVWGTQSLSMLGSVMTFFAVNIWITQVLFPRPEQKASLAFALSANSLAFALPMVLAAPVAGVWADRHDRRRTMIAANLIAAVLGLALVALIFAHVVQLWMLLAFMILYCCTGAFHTAAFDSSYAMLVPPERLPRANAMMQSIWALSGVLSPAAAAALIALPLLARQGRWTGSLAAWLKTLESGVPFAILVDVVTFFFAAIVLMAVAIPSPERADLVDASGARKSMWADARVGADFVLRRPPLLWLVATFGMVNLVWSPILVLQQLLLKFNLAVDLKGRGLTFEAALAGVTMASSLGGILGAVAISVWGGLKRRRVLGVLVPIILLGITMIGYGFAREIPLVCLCAFVSGTFLPAINAHSQSIWQTQTPPELQGRVFAVRRLIAQFTVPIGTGFGGLIGGLLDPGHAIAYLGVAGAAFAIAQLFNPQLRHVEDKEMLDAGAART